MHLPTTTLLALAGAFLLPVGSLAKVSCTGFPADLSDIEACADFLKSLGSQACEVTGGFMSFFCESGSAQVVGTGVGAVGVKTSSPCADIAIAVRRILRSCAKYDGSLEGASSAGASSAGQTETDNNGDILVAIGLKS